MFKPERALTDEEIHHLNYMAGLCLSGSKGATLIDRYPIPTWEGQHALFALECLVREYSKMPEKCADRGDLVAFVEAWPNYVKEYLGTESWEYGYGFVGVVA